MKKRSQPGCCETLNGVFSSSFLISEMNLYEPVSALGFVKRLFFSLICFSPSKEECSKERQLSAVSLKSCTSCTDLGFTRLATAISRKINYDVTQSRPEGAARLHTPKTCSTLSFADDSKQNQSNRAGVNRGEGGRWTGVFSVSVTSMTQIFHQLQNLLAEVEVPQETRLFEIQQQERRHAHVHILYTYTQRHAQTYTATHQIMCTVQQIYYPPLPKSQNKAEVCL